MSFDPAAFLNQTFDEANSTESVPVPEGEFLAISEGTKVDTWQTRDGSKSGLKCLVTWSIQDDNVKQLLERKEVKVRQEFILDTTETGNLDFGKGKNVTLGRLREALDLNTPGQPFAFGMIDGRMGKVLVKHRVYNDSIIAEVKGVVKPS